MAEAGHQGNKLRSLELGRFAAALVVVLSHVSAYVNFHAAGAPLLGGLAFPSALGVQYFFVLSGFVMVSAHYRDFGRPLAPLRFWWRRACRIFPVYWLVLCIPLYYLRNPLTPHLFAHLLLLDPWYFDTQYVLPAWTLRFEMAFYIMFGLSLLPYVGRALLVLWAAAALWHCIDPTMLLLHPRWSWPVYWFLHYHLVNFVSYLDFFFLAGVAAGFAYQWLPLHRYAGMAVLAVCLALLLYMLPAEDWGVNYSTAPLFMLHMGFVIAGILLGLAVLERHGTIRLGRYASWAGIISYPLYLFHQPFLLFINCDLPWGPQHLAGLYLRFAAILITVFAASILIAWCYDQPIQRLLRLEGLKRPGALPLDPAGAAGPRPL